MGFLLVHLSTNSSPRAQFKAKFSWFLVQCLYCKFSNIVLNESILFILHSKCLRIALFQSAPSTWYAWKIIVESYNPIHQCIFGKLCTNWIFIHSHLDFFLSAHPFHTIYYAWVSTVSQNSQQNIGLHTGTCECCVTCYSVVIIVCTRVGKPFQRKVPIFWLFRVIKYLACQHKKKLFNGLAILIKFRCTEISFTNYLRVGVTTWASNVPTLLPARSGSRCQWWNAIGNE